MATEKLAKREEEKDEYEKRFNRYLEETKITSDYLKHLATLDTGLIVVIGAFLQRFIDSNQSELAFLSAGLFLISLIGIVTSQTILVFMISRYADNIKVIPKRGEKMRYLLLALAASLTFLGGLSALIDSFTNILKLIG